MVEIWVHSFVGPQVLKMLIKLAIVFCEQCHWWVVGTLVKTYLKPSSISFRTIKDYQSFGRHQKPLLVLNLELDCQRVIA